MYICVTPRALPTLVIPCPWWRPGVWTAVWTRPWHFVACSGLTGSHWSLQPGTWWIVLYWWALPPSSLHASTPGSHRKAFFCAAFGFLITTFHINSFFFLISFLELVLGGYQLIRPSIPFHPNKGFAFILQNWPPCETSSCMDAAQIWT